MAENQTIPDGDTSFALGQKASLDAAGIPEGAFAGAVNASTDKGNIRPRWGWNRKELDFSRTGNYILPNLQERTFKDVFEAGNFQALIPYSVGPDYYLIIISAGFIFLVNQKTFVVTVLNKEDKLDPFRVRVNWSDADRYLVIFDWPNRPFILEGIEIRRSDLSKNEVPISEAGVYNQSRLFITNAGNEFTGGDPTGNKATPNAPITFNEVLQPSSPYIDQIIRLTTNYGNDPITGLGFLQFTDTSTGIGPLLVSTSKVINTYQTQNPRAQWEAGQFGSNLVFKSGFAGNRSFANLNSDVVFLSSDWQARTLSMSRDEQGKWARVPMSKDVENYLFGHFPEAAPYAAVFTYKNKVLITTNPYRVKSYSANRTVIYDWAFGGFAVMELDSIANLTQDGIPSWCGLWTGVRPMDAVENNNQAFLISKDQGVNRLYQITTDKSYDVLNNRIRPVTVTLYTRAYKFSDETVNKTLSTLHLGINEVRGKINIKSFYKPNQSGNYIFWHEGEYDSPYKLCRACEIGLTGLAPQGIRDYNTGAADDVCDGSGETLSTTFKNIQIKLIISGAIDWKLDYVKVVAVPTEAEEDVFCEVDTAPIIMQCNSDWKIPEERV